MRTAIPSDPSEEARLLVKVTALANRFARRLLPPDDAEDMAQQVVLDCLMRLRTGRWYVHTTLRALVRDMVRRKFMWGLRGASGRKARDAQHLDERTACPPMWMDPAVTLEMKEAEALRAQALAELPERCRAAFLLVRNEGVTHREVAARLGISLRLVASHVVNAERHLASRVLDAGAPTKAPPSMGRRPRRRRLATRGEVRPREVVRARRDGSTPNGTCPSVNAARTRQVLAETSLTYGRTTAIVDETTPTFEQASSISG